jgi:hypothetical protein
MAEATAPPAPPAAKPIQKLPGEVIIEIWDTEIPNPEDEKHPFKGARNRDVLFPPAKTKLRGHWSRNCLTPSEASGESLGQMPAEIPGICIAIDVSRHTVKIFDPLGLPNNKRLLEDLIIQMKAFDGSRPKPWDTKEYKDQSPTQMKTALWWSARLVQASAARVVGGEMPPMKVIEGLPGKTRIELYNNSANAVKFREDLPRDDWEEAQAAVLG